VTESDLSQSEAIARKEVPSPPVVPTIAPARPAPVLPPPDMIVSVERNFHSQDYKMGRETR
jgi:hypothetical protein